MPVPFPDDDSHSTWGLAPLSAPPRGEGRRRNADEVLDLVATDASSDARGGREPADRIKRCTSPRLPDLCVEVTRHTSSLLSGLGAGVTSLTIGLRDVIRTSPLEGVSSLIDLWPSMTRNTGTLLSEFCTGVTNHTINLCTAPAASAASVADDREDDATAVAEETADFLEPLDFNWTRSAYRARKAARIFCEDVDADY
jgi:hypothetical protein